MWVRILIPRIQQWESESAGLWEFTRKLGMAKPFMFRNRRRADADELQPGTARCDMPVETSSQAPMSLFGILRMELKKRGERNSWPMAKTLATCAVFRAATRWQGSKPNCECSGVSVMAGVWQ